LGKIVPEKAFLWALQKIINMKKTANRVEGRKIKSSIITQAEAQRGCFGGIFNRRKGDPAERESREKLTLGGKTDSGGAGRAKEKQWGIGRGVSQEERRGGSRAQEKRSSCQKKKEFSCYSGEKLGGSKGKSP